MIPNVIESPSSASSSEKTADHTPTTPMMEQYIEIKMANPDMLLFYRMGDFYELFFEDAEKASKVLGIALTKRGKHKGSDIPMCGVPIHTAEDYLHKLINAGFCVAVCEQTENPAEAKKRGSKSIVRRDVVRLVTPGTLTEDKLLSPFEPNFLLALSRFKTEKEDIFGLSWIDISTGEFCVSEIEKKDLISEIARINPREIILPDSVFRDPSLSLFLDTKDRVIVPTPDTMFDSVSGLNRVLRFYNIATLESFGSFSKSELSAICSIIAYIEKTQKSAHPSLGRPQKRQTHAFLHIDAATRSNLELTRSLNGNREGSLLKAIDCTLTSAGARLLSNRLLAPITNPEKIYERLDSISFFLEHETLCTTLRSQLKSVADMPRSLSRLSLNRGNPRDLGALSKNFETIDLLLALLKNQKMPPEIAQSYAVLSQMPREYSNCLKSALSDELPFVQRDGGFIRAGYNAELDEIRTLRDESRKIIARMETSLIEETNIRSLKIRHNNILGYYIEINASHHPILASYGVRFIHRQTMSNAMRFTTADLSEIEIKISQAAERALAIELSIFETLVAQAISYAELIRSASHALAILDVSSSLAFLSIKEKLCRPEVDNSLAFSIEAGRHLVVEQSLRSVAANPFVANDCNLCSPPDKKKGDIWLLTGPNMGGKSTFLRQNALIVILAQMGSFVPAKKAYIGVADQLFSRVGACDDLARGRSTFMVEMVETAIILNQASPRSLVILDEIGRGTSTFDGLSIAWAVAEHLHNINQCRAIFATHFHEMSILSQKLERFKNVTMCVKEWQNNVIFLHEITAGAADRSYGIQVAKLAGLPKAVTERAQEILQKLEKQENQTKKSLTDPLPLFNAYREKEKINTIERTENQKIIEKLKSLQVDSLTPREALELLYTLKEKIT